MANQNAKKTKQKNEQILNRTYMIAAGIFAVYVLYRMGLHYDSFGFWQWIGFSVFVVLNAFCIGGLSSMAKPSYNNSGEITYGGEDLDGKGLVEYYFDVLYITWFVQVTTMFSNLFWFVFLVIPAFGIYKFVKGGLANSLMPNNNKVPVSEGRGKREKVRYVKG